MISQQVSLTLPKVLYEESEEYTKEYGYKNLQELILELLRQKVVLEKVERYKMVELSLEKEKGMPQKEAIKRLKGL